MRNEINCFFCIIYYIKLIVVLIFDGYNEIWLFWCIVEEFVVIKMKVGFEKFVELWRIDNIFEIGKNYY